MTFIYTMKNYLTLVFLSFSLFIHSYAMAGGVYQEPDAFINQAFNGNPPKPAVLWINKDLKKQITSILNHKYKGLRIRYWKNSNIENKKSVWILEEIGKEKPITTGFIINNRKIELVKVLIFRESRGWEVRHNFFSNQFKQAALTEGHQLTINIDNISGATLSVRAIEKLSRIALLLDSTIHKKIKDKTNIK